MNEFENTGMGAGGGTPGGSGGNGPPRGLWKKYGPLLVASGLVLACVLLWFVVNWALGGPEVAPESAANEAIEVVYAFPADGSRDVPLRSGVEVELNTTEPAIAAFDSAFTIQPHTAGRFRMNGDRYVFEPTEGYEPKTLYTVTIEGLYDPHGNTQEEPFSFSFTTANEDKLAIQTEFALYGARSVNVLTDAPPVVEAHFAYKPSRVDVEVFAFSDPDDYAQALLAGAEDAEQEIPTQDLEFAGAFEAEVYEGGGDEYSGPRWAIVLPEPLPEGWYVANFRITDNQDGAYIKRQKLIQVSDLSLFYMWTGDDLLCWVNDAETGGPAAGAAVTLAGGYQAEAVTGEDGAALVRGTFVRQEDVYAYHNLVYAEWQGRQFLDLANFYQYGQDPAPRVEQLYMAYLYTDRPLYRRTDTVEVWGFVKPRDPSAALPGDVALKIGNVWSDSAGDADTRALALAADGTFRATIELEEYADSWCGLGLLVGGENLTTTSFTVEDFVKPALRILCAPDKLAYVNGEAGEITLRVEMFDGTPVPGYALSVAVEGGEIACVTDDEGEAAVAFTAKEDRYSTGWQPAASYFTVTGTDPAAHKLEDGGRYYVFGRDTMVNASVRRQGARPSLEITVNRIELGGIEGEGDIWNTEGLRGSAADIPLTATVTRVYYEKTKKGTRYDYINRQSVDVYDYTRREEELKQYDFTTQDGVYTLEDLPEIEEGWLQVTINGKDAGGRALETSLHLGAHARYDGRYSDSSLAYSLEPVPDDMALTTEDDQWYGYYSTGYFADGESVDFHLTLNEEPVAQMTGRLLYCLVQNDIREVTVSASGTLRVPFAEALLPNYTLTGAYFDGKYVYALSNTSMYFDASSRALDIEITPTATGYAPGDEVTLALKATHNASGEAAAGTSLVVGVADEAVFALYEQYTGNLPAAMYYAVYYPQIHTYASHRNDSSMSGAEMGGGGGGGEYRREFEDTAWFGTATTGADGRARVSFTLPDNITEWRITALGVTRGGHAGAATGKVQASLGYFVAPVLNERLLEGDSYVVGLYSAGRGIDKAKKVAYTVEVEGAGVKESKEVTSTLRGYTTLDFGKLPAGEYTVRVQGACQGFTDGVEHSFSVVKSGLALPLVQTFDVAEGIRLTPLRYPVSVTFYDEAAAVYNRVLRGVQHGGYSERADARLARRYIAERGAAEGAWYDPAALTESIHDLKGDRLLRLLPYDQTSLALTLRAHLALPDLVGTGGMRDYFYEEYTPEPGAETLAWALLYGEVPDGAFTLLERGGGFADSMYAVMALAAGGGTAEAGAWYDTLVPGAMETTRLPDNSVLYAIPGDGSGTLHDNTAAACLAATMLGREEDATGFVQYLAERASRYDLYVLEEIYFLEHFAPPGTATASLRYSVEGGAARSLETGRYGASLTFTKSEWESAEFEVTSGRVLADVYFTGTPAQLAGADETIGLTKTIEPVGGEYRVGGLVKITITTDYTAFDTSSGWPVLYLEDVLPAGLRFENHESLNSPWDYNGGWYLSGREGQSVHFTVNPGQRRKGNSPIVYYARVATPGEYVVESAYITGASAAMYGTTPRQAITIEEG